MFEAFWNGYYRTSKNFQLLPGTNESPLIHGQMIVWQLPVLTFSSFHSSDAI